MRYALLGHNGAHMDLAPPRTVAEAVLRTVAYADIFTAPVSLTRLHRYLELAARPNEVRAAVAALTPDRLAFAGELVALAGRDELFVGARRRQAFADRLWPLAMAWGRRLARGPWVRMVAVTGALAMDNVDDGADIDYLVVAEPGRVWLARWWVVQQVRHARLRDRVVLCPNWVLAGDALALEHRDLFAARELAQMVPVAGATAYADIVAANSWIGVVLPNAAGPPSADVVPTPPPARVARLAESAFGGGLGYRLEDWERRRKAREIARRAGASPEVVLDERQCKGHVDGHGQRIAREWQARLTALDLA